MDEKNTLQEVLAQERMKKERRVEDRLLLKQYQPVAFDILERAIQQDRISHAYLFYGPKGTMKLEMAKLFAQSILMHAKDGLIQEETLVDKQATLASRIGAFEYGDMLFLDGSRKKKLSKK